MDKVVKTKKEKDIVRECLANLNKVPGTFAFRIENRPGMARGVSDILACCQGQFLAIEVKVPGNRPTALQERFIGRVKDSGGLAACIHSAEELKQALHLLKNDLYEVINES
jgi:hypothetical protein